LMDDYRAGRQQISSGDWASAPASLSGILPRNTN